jgi:microcin C transport system substrate-binding protein
VVPKAQWWAEEIPDVEGVKRGLLVPRKFYNDAPIGTSGIAINMERPPLDDLNIRKALQLLHDRKTMIEKLYFNEYKPLTSYWQGGTYMNPNNKLIEYDEFGAVELLEKSGWTEINEEGYRVKDGKVLGFSLVYRSALSERSLTIFQEACKRAGIKIELQQLTPASAWKNLREKEYELMSTAWGAIIFPNPESSWHSKYADQKDTNNVTAFADPEVDKLIEEYDKEYDVNRRIELMREIDGLVYNQFPYVLEWYLPAQRVLYRNKYGMPEWGVPRTVDSSQMHMIWWVDPDLEKQLDAARADKTLTMEADTSNNTFWVAWNEAQQGG